MGLTPIATRNGAGEPDLLQVGIVLAAVNDASRRLRRWLAPSLTAAARGADSASGRGKKAAFNRTKKRPGRLTPPPQLENPR
jgi:hypothetical protein